MGDEMDYEDRAAWYLRAVVIDDDCGELYIADDEAYISPPEDPDEYLAGGWWTMPHIWVDGARAEVCVRWATCVRDDVRDAYGSTYGDVGVREILGELTDEERARMVEGVRRALAAEGYDVGTMTIVGE